MTYESIWEQGKGIRGLLVNGSTIDHYFSVEVCSGFLIKGRNGWIKVKLRSCEIIYASTQDFYVEF